MAGAILACLIAGLFGWRIFNPAQVSAELLGCVPTPNAQIDGQPTPITCVDSNFRPSADGFSFRNWSGITLTDSVTLPTLEALFGKEHVCVNDGDAKCTPLPEAMQWVSLMNSLLSNGRCEGMSVDAERFFTGLSTIVSADPDATSVANLTRDNPRLVSDINYWWLTQLMPEVVAESAATRKLPPSRIVANVTGGLRDGASNTMGLYSTSGAHAVTPFAVTYEDPFFTIWVYDSNHPGAAGRIVVDPKAESWRYLAPGATQDQGWAGVGPGGLEYTPMQARMQDFTTPFSNDPNENGYFAIIIASSTNSEAEVDMRITYAGLEVSSASTDPLPEGVLSQHIDDDASGYSTIMYIHPPSAIEITATSTEPQSPVSMVIDGPLLRWQEAVLTSNAPGPLPLQIKVGVDGTVQYAVSAAVEVEVSTLDDAGRLVRHRISGPGDYRVQGFIPTPS